MKVEWYRCTGWVWCNLYRLDIEHEYLDDLHGVYVIWAGENERKVLKVGRGYIREELKEMKNDLAIQAFSHHGVFVSWAEVSGFTQGGVELFLNNVLSPAISEDTPKALPIKINLPWDENSLPELPEEDDEDDD
ncbi:MAG: hypothetical protein ACOC2K_02405 [Bacteroidota bacterium]